MRLLHTSDWHLGTSIEKASTREEQARFLDWLVEELARRESDVLVVAGDVFHYASPANWAKELYYDFLVGCASLETLDKVVVVAGNHDSPSGLEAPARVLEVLDVEVVGRIPSEAADRDDCLIPVEDESGEVVGVVAAVPYVRQARLGVGLRGDGEGSRHERYARAFRELYADLAERARRKWPDVPVVTTGHLTAYGRDDDGEPGDFETAIHAAVPNGGDGGIGTIDPFPPELFEPYDYAALGHLHRPMRVGDSSARYSGSPVPTKREEADGQRRVVDVRWPEGAGEPQVEWVAVPQWRDIERIEGTRDEVLEALEALTYDEPLPPYLYLEVHLEEGVHRSEVLTQAQQILKESFDEAEPPRIVDDSFYDPDAEWDEGGDDEVSLEDVEPMEVFLRKFRRDRGDEAEPGDRLVEAFRELEQRVDDPEPLD